MQAPGDVIDAVRCWYDTHMQRPATTKSKTQEEIQLAKRWNSMLKNKLTLSAEHLAEAECLEAQFDTGVDQLAVWMHEHRRRPKHHRGKLENILARKWGRHLKGPAPLPPKLQVIQDLMSNNMAWIEAEAADVTLHTGVDQLVAWMNEHKRYPKRDRGDGEDGLAVHREVL